jgi:5'-methylthioadenosine phosphorylase
MSERTPVLGVIGGSGLYRMPGLENVREHDIDTPFGKPSSSIIIGDLKGKTIAFLARHGSGHHLSPSEVNYRANIHAMKQVGVERIVAVSACGSLREDYAPGEIVVPDQLYDNTKDRQRTFFEKGLVIHIGAAEPFCAIMGTLIEEGVQQVGGNVHKGGAFITIEGPRFSTRAESNTFRAWGMSIIGMTTSPEAFLAREAEICYSVMAHVTDYDVWHIAEEPVSVEMVVRILQQNTQMAQDAIENLVGKLPRDRSDCGCSTALKDALITDAKRITTETKQRLALLIGSYLS